MNNDSMVDIVDLHKWFGLHEVLKGVNLKVRPSEVLVVVGPSGSGKSTMLRCVNGLEHATSGHIFISRAWTSPVINRTSMPYARRWASSSRASTCFPT